MFRIKEKLARFIPSNSLQWISNNVKRVAVTSVTVAALSLGSVYADSGEEGLNTIYHIYLNGEQIGTVNDISITEEVIEQKIDSLKEEYKSYSLDAGEQLTYIPEKVFRPYYNNEEALETLAARLVLQAEAEAIEVNGNPVAYVQNKEQVEEVLNKIKLQYVSESVLDRLKGKDEIKRNEIPLELNESSIIDVSLKEKVSSFSTKVKPTDILSLEEAEKLLQKGTLEDKIHTVAAGEILGRIALKYDLSINDILTLNPDLSEDTLLQIGQEINVTDYEPYINVVVKEKGMKSVEVPYEIIVEKDEDMYKGTSKVKQEGKKGEKNVEYVTTKINNEVTEEEIINEKTIKEPVNKIVIKGTKVVPSRGTGDFAWPTVKGIITSKMGYRWGRMHKGIDIARPSNKSILAADNGVVSFAGWDGDYGNKVVINHNNGIKTIYAHLSSIKVKKGQTVPRGTKIGVMGTTGRSTGTHLHFEVIKNGKNVNPLNYY